MKPTKTITTICLVVILVGCGEADDYGSQKELCPLVISKLEQDCRTKVQDTIDVYIPHINRNYTERDTREENLRTERDNLKTQLAYAEAEINKLKMKVFLQCSADMGESE